MIRKLLSVAVLIVVSTMTAFAQQKPDFSGTWKLNVAKSDFGALPGPDSRTDVNTHKEPSLTDDVKAEGEQGKQQYSMKYTTDAKEVTNQMGPREIKSTLKWEGNNLIVSSKLTYNNMDVTGVSNWSLSADGKTLIITIHYTSAMGETDQKFILEKQETTAPVPAKTP